MRCENCGVDIMPGSAFCASCGKSITESTVASRATAPTSAAISPRVAAALCYLAGFVLAIVFLAAGPYRRDSFIRFHAYQSIYLSASWILLHFALRGLLTVVPWTIWRLINSLSWLTSIVFLATTLFLTCKAFVGERFLLRILGELAARQA